MARPRKNQAYTATVAMVDSTNPALFRSGEVVTDTAYRRATGGAWTSHPITDTFSEIGTTGIYDIALTAAEMNYDQILIKATSPNAQATYIFMDLETNSFDDLAVDIDAILADTGTDGVAISAVVKNAIADHVLRRSFANAKAAAGPDTKTIRSLLGATAKQVNRVEVVGSSLSVYEDDDSTVLGTQTVTSSPGANPITGFDTD